MHILHVYKDYFPVLGGIENHVKLLAEGQAARGHDVTVLVTSLDRHSHVETIRGVHVIFASRVLNLSSAPLSVELVQKVGDIHADVTHLHAPYPVGEVAHLLFGKTRAAMVTYHSDIVRQKLMGALYTPVLHRVLDRVDKIIATSPNYIASSPVLARHQEKCVVVPLGIPASLIEMLGAATPLAARTELVFVGRLRYYKGLNFLLQALTFLPAARLTVVGTGPMENDWRALAETLGVAARVVWAGEVNDAALPSYYASGDIFVLPCSERSEAFGAVQLEAMAAGKPIVSCDVNTGVAWVNQNGVTGLVVPPKNPQALAQAMRQLLDDAALRARMGAAGQARVRQEFTADKLTGRVLDLYAQTLSSAHYDV